jgi:hypothetical protein
LSNVTFFVTIQLYYFVAIKKNVGEEIKKNYYPQIFERFNEKDR